MGNGTLLRPHRALLLMVGIILLLGAAFLLTQPRLQQAECPVTPATEQDFAEAIAIGEGVFQPDRWTLEYLEHPALISVGWSEPEPGAFAHGQYVLYNCGYSDRDLAEFYGDENMAVMYGGADSYELTAACEQDGLSLREYAVAYDGRPYLSRFWIEPVSETRVRDMRLDFPTGERDRLDEYSARLYPELASCKDTVE